jgi:hypothetical protein
MNYFNNSLNFSNDKKKLYLIKGFNYLLKPFVGDVLKIFFSRKGAYYFFEGFCFSLTKKQFLSFDSSISLVYKVKGIYITIVFSFFANLLFAYEKVDFKRFYFFLKRAKLNTFKSLVL